MRRLWTLLIIAQTLPTWWCHAFQVSTPLKTLPRSTTATSTITTVLYGMRRIDPYDEDDDSSFDVEAVRQRLEALVGAGGEEGIMRRKEETTATPRPRQKSSSPPSHDDVPSPSMDVRLPPAPPLTTLERERRQAEIRLLAQLEGGDDSLSDLWTLWFQERGPEAAKRLLMAEELTGQGPARWQQAETILRELMEEYGVYWAEPVNRLATLYYMQGKFEQAETLCKMVIAVKPWHFGALSGIVMVYAGMHESESARQWAARRLPTFAPTGPNRRRKAWVSKALKDANDALEAAEQRVVEAFGKPDEYTTTRRRNQKPLDQQEEGEEEDAWQ